MAEITNRQVNIYIETGSAQAALDILKKKEKELKDALEKATDPRVVAKLSSELKKLEQPIESATKKLSGKLAPSIRDISKTVQALERDLKNLSKDDPGFNKKINQYRQAKTELEALRKQALGVNETINKSGGVLGKIQSAGASVFTGLAQGFGIGLGVSALQQLPGLLQDSVDEFLQAEEASARLENKLKNLGRSDAFDRIQKKAQDLADRFKFLDNDDIVGVFDKLITYGKLTESQMNQLLPVIINFASDSRISLQESAGVIIKALEGNGKALKEYGINIKDAGTLSERFGVVVNQLGEKVKGAADAFGETLPGKMAKMKQAFADFKENVGSFLAPAFTFILEKLNGAIQGYDLLFESINRGISGGRLQKQRDDLETINRGSGLTDKQKNALSKLSAADKQKVTDAERKRLDDLKAELEKARQGTDAEIELLLERNVALQERRLSAILEVINGNKILGTGGGNDNGENPAAKAAKERADEIAKLNAELRDLVESFDVKRLSEFQQKVADIDKAFSKLEERAYKTNNGDLVNRIIQARQNEIENAYAELLQSRVSTGPGAVDLTDPIGSIFDLAKGRTPGQAAQNKPDPNKKEKMKLSERISMYVDYANQVTSIFSDLSSKIADREDQDLEADRRKTEKKKENYTRLLESNLISRKEYDRKNAIADLELERKEKAVRKRQFRRDQIESSLRVAINTAEGISKALTSPATAPIVISIISALAAVQLGLIASKKYPEFAKGGRLNGPTHKEGGMPVINPRTGQKEAEVEGGEVILSRNTVRNNARIVNELLYSSMHRNGQRISAVYARGGRLPGINFSHASQSVQRLTRYERGGTFGPSGSDTAVLEETIQNMNMTLARLQQQLDGGIVAYASIQQFNKQQGRLDSIIEDVTMK